MSDEYEGRPRFITHHSSLITRFGENLSSFRDDAADWASGRSWMLRLPLLAYLAYGFVRHLGDELYSTLLFGGVTFGIHELGHVIFGFAGTFISVAGGTFSQLAAPIAAGFILLRQRDYFGVSVTTVWLSYSLFGVATYMADAQERDIPLLGLSDDPIHDWWYMLSSVGLLSADDGLAALTRVVAFVTGAAALAVSGWLCLVMFRSPARGHGAL